MARLGEFICGDEYDLALKISEKLSDVLGEETFNSPTCAGPRSQHAVAVLAMAFVEVSLADSLMKKTTPMEKRLATCKEIHDACFDALADVFSEMEKTNV